MKAQTDTLLCQTHEALAEALMADDDDDNTGERQHFASILRAYDNYLPWAMRPPGCPARWPLLSVGKGSNRTRRSGEVPVGEARMRARLPVAPPTPTQCVPTR